MIAMWWGGRRTLAAALASVLLAGMTAVPATASPEGEAVQSYGQPPVWGSCAQTSPTAVPTAQCGTVSVPVDYAQPDGPQAQLAVIRVPASGDRIGVLMVNPGGPGASAVDTVAGMGAALADTEIGRRFDLVGFDPRGVGHSTPQLRCRTDAEFDAYRREPLADYSPAGVAHIEGIYRRLAQQCADRMGLDFLANVGTASAARDMDVVRSALGENQISYLGFSYGTQLGAAYAGRYPERVRAMVLDGAVDPSADPIAKNISQQAGFQKAFEAYAADCAESAGCPLGTDPAQFNNRFHQLVDPLATRPAATSDPRGLGYQDAITGTGNALYSARYWPYLTSGLLGLQRGTDPGDLLTLADEYQGRTTDGRYSNAQDAFTAIRCVDTPFPTDPAVYAAADRRVREVAPFFSYGQFTGFAPRDVCALWPVPATSTPAPATSPGPGKVVVVSTTGDPATPYAAGVALAKQLGASLITFEGKQHTVVFNGDACVDTAVVRFLVNGVVPPNGLECRS
ncbi:hydrolase [Mycobacterium sp. 852013-51886_SCH5428379]|uniref:alpha/beta hydrolase n=1 Tax=Mycobacterium sp. 852013-51886_SCH5428379 TaxID=1834111 RepID=UPI000801E068|nr:alpha/beta hydrolase [Mycobacterium sp. 852013-51886_SCH5428379]OBB59411.1 hydrolase [Mycobacterium sp. 852013-51886_SCH5428379]